MQKSISSNMSRYKKIYDNVKIMTNVQEVRFLMTY